MMPDFHSLQNKFGTNFMRITQATQSSLYPLTLISSVWGPFSATKMPK